MALMGTVDGDAAIFGNVKHRIERRARVDDVDFDRNLPQSQTNQQRCYCGRIRNKREIRKTKRIVYVGIRRLERKRLDIHFGLSTIGPNRTGKHQAQTAINQSSSVRESSTQIKRRTSALGSRDIDIANDGTGPTIAVCFNIDRSFDATTKHERHK
jgi:hypothetical protein